MQVLIVIPARMASSRFPGKPLAEIAGRSLILRVCDRASLVPGAEGVLVATDDSRIYEHVKDAGYEARMTSPDHASGSDRIAEATEGREGLILNLQGDEPLADPELMGRLIVRLRENPSIDIGTVGLPLEAEELGDPDRVKVLVDERARALDFRRIPEGDPGPGLRLLRHAGLYLYRAEALRAFVSVSPGEREKREGLEQLRALDLGLYIHVEEGLDWAPGVDRPGDLKVIENRLEES